MVEKIFVKMVRKATEEKRRLVAPLLGFPGLNLTGCNIKLAQQNYYEHFKVMKSITDNFSPDAVFPLMDLSVEANALGRYTLFPREDSATVVKDHFEINDLVSAKDINIKYDTRLLGYVETLKLMSTGLPGSILRGAYVTGPYSLAGLLMGADEAAMATIMRPDELHEILQFTTAKILEYIRLIIASDVQIICILEPSAVMLGPDQFEEFSGNYVKYINENCKYTGISTVYHVCGDSTHLVDKMVESGVDGLSLDSPNAGIDLPAVGKKLPGEIILIGNVDPVGAMLHGTPEDVETEVYGLLEKMDFYENFVLSTGCDLPQEIKKENILAFMKAGREYKVKSNSFAKS